MILPDKSGAKIFLLALFISVIPWLSFMEIRKLRSVKSKESEKWVRLKKLQIICAMTLGCAGLLHFMDISPSSTDNYLFGLAILSLITWGYIEDKYTKFRKDCDISEVMMTESEKTIEEGNRLTPVRWAVAGALLIAGLIIGYVTVYGCRFPHF